MMKNNFLFLLVLLSFHLMVGQGNNEKYIYVPSQYDFLKESNQYQLNELTKFLFEKDGFKVYSDEDEIPSTVVNNPCNALYADVKDDSGMFVTGLQIIIYDCNKKEVYVTEVGKSRDKVYKTAYHEALRNSFKSIGGLKMFIGNATPSISSEEENKVIPAAVEAETNTPSPGSSPEVVTKGKETIIEPLLKFTEGNYVFYLKQTNSGFHFFQEGSPEPFATLIQTKTGGLYIYNSVKNQGVALFDAENNLVVEVVSNPTNSTIVTKYLRSN